MMSPEADARVDLRWYLIGAVAAGLPQKASDSILELADAMVAAATAGQPEVKEWWDHQPFNGALHHDWCQRSNSRGMSRPCNCGEPKRRRAAEKAALAGGNA